MSANPTIGVVDLEASAAIADELDMAPTSPMLVDREPAAGRNVAAASQAPKSKPADAPRYPDIDRQSMPDRDGPAAIEALKVGNCAAR